MTIALDRPRVEEIARAATELPITEIAAYLQAQLGQKITAYISGIKDAKLVGQWKTGAVVPRDLAMIRLRNAYHATRLIVEAYGKDTAKAWFFGSNTRLNDQAPGYLLRHAKTLESLPNIVSVAKAFAGSTD